MARYTAKDLRNITKDELCELLTKEGIAFDPSTSYFTLRALLLNETKNDESMSRKNKQSAEVETIETDGTTEMVTEQTSETETDGTTKKADENPSENPSENKPVEPTEQTDENPINVKNSLSALRSEIVKRRGGVGLGKSAFAAELAKRRGERVTGVTFAQELRSRQLKYSGK